MKQTLITLTIIAVMLGSAACGNGNVERLKQHIETLNKRYAEYTDLTNFEYNDSTNIVRMNFLSYSDSRIDMMHKNNDLVQEIVKLDMTYDRGTKEFDKLVKLAVNADAGFVYTYKSDNGKTFDAKISADELKEIYNTPSVKDPEKTRLLLEKSIELANIQRPYAMPSGIAVNCVEDKGDNIEFFCSTTSHILDKYGKSDTRPFRRALRGDIKYCERKIAELAVSLNKGIVFKLFSEIDLYHTTVDFTTKQVELALTDKSL